MTVDDNVYPLNGENLTQPIEMQLSQTQKAFPGFFVFFSFSKSILKFKLLQKNMTLIADVFPEIPAKKNMVRSISKKPCIRGLLDRKGGKCIETLLQSEWQHLYNIY